MVTAPMDASEVKFSASLESCDCEAMSPCEVPTVSVSMQPTQEATLEVCSKIVEGEAGKWSVEVEQVNANCRASEERNAEACTKEKELRESECEASMQAAQEKVDGECRVSVESEEKACESKKAVS